jgi:hypothetical protein
MQRQVMCAMKPFYVLRERRRRMGDSLQSAVCPSIPLALEVFGSRREGLRSFFLPRGGSH